jgi:hypothetical protein
MLVGDQQHAPVAFTPVEEPVPVVCIGTWAGLRVALDRCGKIYFPPGFDPRTVQLLASRYTH